MADEKKMKAAMQAYIDAFNREDAEAIIALYAEDATVEDPVGKPPMVGKGKIADFYRMAIGTKAKLTLAAPIRASHGNSAAMAFDVQLHMPPHLAKGKGTIRVIDVMTFNERGEFASMKAYWGQTDMELQAPA